MNYNVLITATLLNRKSASNPQVQGSTCFLNNEIKQMIILSIDLRLILK